MDADVRTRIERRPPNGVYRSLVDYGLSGPALLRHWREVSAARQARAYAPFVGYPRSGTTLVAQLINAHPDVVVSLEVDVVNRLRWPFAQRQLLALIVARDRAWDRQGRRWAGYEYRVESGWQCRHRSVAVVGDKKSAATALALSAHPELAARLYRRIGLPMRWIHVIRNPFDVVSTMTRRSGVDAAHAIRSVERMAAGVEVAKASLRDGDSMLEVRLEDLIAEPRIQIERITAFFEVEAEPEYVAACVEVVFATPRSTRSSIDWRPDERSLVEALIERHDWFRGYDYR